MSTSTQSQTNSLPSRLQLEAVSAYAIPSFERAGLLRLDINERPDGAPEHVVQAVRACLGSQEIATYPTYASWLEHATAWFGVPADHIVPTSGADEGIRAIIDTWLMPGKALITHEPGFDMFAIGARLHGNPVVGVAWRPDGPAWLGFDSETWHAALNPRGGAPEPGLVAIANPSNPTGAMVPRAAIEQTLELVDCPVIVDETYGAFLGETAIDLVAEHPHLFVVHSFSKVHGLAGLRIGAVVSQPGNIDRLRRVLNPYNVGRPAIAASIACMKRPDDAREHVERVRAAREVFVGAMERLDCPTGAENANFVLVHVGDDSARLTEALRGEQILIRDRDRGHPDLSGCVRVAVGTKGQMLRVAGGFRKHLRPPPRIDYLMLDMDGTMVDVSRSYRRAIMETARTLLAESGADEATLARIDDAYVDSFKARGGLNNDWDCTAAICAENGLNAERYKVIDTFQKLYRGDDFDGYIASEPWLMSPEAVATIKAKWPAGVVTGRPRAEAFWTIDKHTDGLFSVVVGMEDTTRDKPDPEPIDRAMRQFGEGPSAYIGDSVDDMRAARAAGVFAIGVLTSAAVKGGGWQSGWPERLHEAGADVVFPHINDAIAWLAADGGAARR